MNATLDLLDSLTIRGRLVQPEENDAVRCLACAHRCLIRPGRRGICLMRFNRDGELRVPWGYTAGLQIDPVEKKPFSHVLPGSRVLTFGMLGCNFHCAFCQNWYSSQAARDPQCTLELHYSQRITPQQMAALAQRGGAQMIVSSYNEPLITAEWAEDVFKEACAAGLRCAMVSNGYATREALEALRPYLCAYKIDLKSMQDRRYREMGGVLQHVLDTIRMAHEMGLWVEVVTLVIPGFNDSNEELWDAARYLASVSRDIPWHVTAFHPDYKMLETEPTPARTLQRAAEIGQEAGLNFVYAGNLPGRVGSLEDTFCPACGERLIHRNGYVILDYRLDGAGCCPKCGQKVAGIWPASPQDVNLGGLRGPRRI